MQLFKICILNLYFYRLSNTFRLVNNFHWIIVEDSEIKTPLVANLLSKSRLNYTHLAIGTPNEWKRKLKV